MIVVLDLGASFYKALFIDSSNKEPFPKVIKKGFRPAKASDSVSDVEEWLSEICLVLPEKVIVTGGRSRFYPDNLTLAGTSVSVFIVPELQAIARSCGSDSEKLVVSIGTGTAVVKWDDGFAHMGGTGIGGGTLFGLGKLLTSVSEFSELEDLAKKGSRSGADISVGDILGTGIGGFSINATASNFGKVSFSNPSKVDLALACFTLTVESILVLVDQIAKRTGIRDIWITGNLVLSKRFQVSLFEAAKEIGLGLNIHKDAWYATALGAYDAYLHGR